ncbi:prolyl oligopeptidase family serine peptidase [Corynebacterium sp. zg254]|uniref:S9 family peptidase n=1 Tax=Corynebacterium zhongnanshanii TaxID=2768834 RepID=A0ABQ6VCW3_9CORY|nr:MULTISPECIES: S9 family peptidase [Corynebacterium]KAB3519804.1 S9 family peptidase [Corynebacterium zhongnanshanii]MCR5914732.1 prolyl oligopeptidase family serine peptidase [Corynebacterium sp. zg254]
MSTVESASARPPQPKKVLHRREHHGRVFEDNYEWMREKDSPELRAHLEAENAYTQARTGHLKTLSENIFQEVKARVQETDMTLPVRNRQWWYFSRTQEGKSYATMCRIKVEDPDDWTPPTIDPATPHPDEEAFLDCNELAEGHEFFNLGAASLSFDGSLLAYSVDTTGDERFTLRIKDLTTGELLDDQIDGIFYGATWVGNDTIYYQRVDDAWRPHEIWKHTLGSEEDQLVYREDDEHFWTSVSTTRSERFLLIGAGSKVTSEAWFLDLEDPNAELTCILPREDNVDYGVDHAIVGGEDMWLIVHNRNGVNSELAYHPVGVVNSLDDATTLVAHRDDARVEGVSVFANHVVLESREHAIERAFLMSLNNDAEHPGAQAFTEFEEITFDEELASVITGNNGEWNAPVLRVGVSSFTTPARVFDVDLATGERHLRKQQVVLPGPDGREFDPSEYAAERRWVTSRDGVKIPVSVIHRADVDVNAENPVLLYAYGSYETSMDPGFSVFRLSMLDRGVVYVIAHVRGGGEMGRAWYDTGKGLLKKNTFHDFIDVADYLIAEGMTTPEKMVAEGGSAGGMLMGAVANMAGDRFAGIEAVVPFVDPLTSMLMPELPLTVTEWDEWGDPFHDPQVYDYMASYAPYENISADKTYPPILAITSINDTRVLYVEPAKWVAKLREVAGADVLLKCELSGGHGGVSGRYEKWRQAAFETAWEIDRMGLQDG